MKIIYISSLPKNEDTKNENKIIYKKIKNIILMI